MTDEVKFVLGVDLDGVVADFTAGLRPIAAEWLGIELADLPADVSYGFPEWQLDQFGGYESLHRYAVKERNLFETLPPLTGAPATLRKLSARGLRIRIITHRLYIPWFHKQAILQTTEWLERHAIPYWDICFMRDKSAVGADLYIEDNPANIEALRGQGYATIVVRNSTNDHLTGPGASEWPDIETLVLDTYEDWRASNDRS